MSKVVIVIVQIILLFAEDGQGRCDWQFTTVLLANSLTDHNKPMRCTRSVCEEYKAPSSGENLEKWLLQGNTYPTASCSLVITGTDLGTVHQKMFIATDSLVQLFLNGTKIKSVQSGSFKNLNSLGELHLEDNLLETLEHDSLDSLPSLEYLYLGRNKLKELNRFYEKNPELSLLTLNDNQLETLPKDLGDRLPKMKFLDISNNPFKTIDHASLHLYQFNCRKIGLHAVQNHRLSSLNQNIVIDLELSELLSLDLSLNQIGEIQSDTFRTAIELTALNLSGNSLEQMHNDSFANQNRLKSLDLSNNDFKSLPRALFANLTSLQQLDLSGNELNVIPFGLLDDLHNLNLLNLSSNDLEEVHLPNRHSNRFMDLFLDNNQLQQLSLENLVRIRRISLDKNMWHCVVLTSIVSYLERHEVEIIDGTTLDGDDTVRKIACDSSKSVSINRPIHSSYSSADFYGSSLNQFLNEGFKKSGFFKYFNDFNISSQAFHRYYEEALGSLRNISKQPALALENLSKTGNVDSLRVVLCFIAIALYGLVGLLLFLCWIWYRNNNYSLFRTRSDHVELL